MSGRELNVLILGEVPEEGTRVRVNFPGWRDLSDSDAAEETGEQEGPNGAVTVLLVEDELTLQQSYCDILELDNYQVLTASTVEEAKAAARSNGDRIDMIVTDLVLPDGRGTDLTGDLLEEIGSHLPSPKEAADATPSPCRRCYNRLRCTREPTEFHRRK